MSQDVAHQLRSQSPRWAPDLATSTGTLFLLLQRQVSLSSPSSHPHPSALSLSPSQKKPPTNNYDPNRIGGTGTRTHSQIRAQWPPLYQAWTARHPPWLSQWSIRLWPGLSDLTEESKPQYHIPSPLPFIVHEQDGRWLIDGDNGKFYLWQNVEDHVGEFYERDSAILLSTITNRGGNSDIYFMLHGCKLIHFFD